MGLEGRLRWWNRSLTRVARITGIEVLMREGGEFRISVAATQAQANCAGSGRYFSGARALASAAGTQAASRFQSFVLVVAKLWQWAAPSRINRVTSLEAE